MNRNSLFSGVRPWMVLGGVLSLTALSACTREYQDIRAWMNVERKKATPHITAVSKPASFVPASYEHGASVDPFDADRLIIILRGENNTNAQLFDAENNRRKEPLESYSLEQLQMVGSLEKDGQSIALIKANNLIYQIRVGNYMGKNFGRVTKITDSGLQLREVIQSATGVWGEQTTAVQLQEAQGKAR